MNNISYFLLTEVKGKNISTAERVANFFLIPAQYLWNGKKIDFIQEPGRIAIQMDFIYTAKERSWVKTAAMVVLVVPGILLGSAFKAYATCRYHVTEHDTFMKKCLDKKIGKILIPKGQGEFGTKISHLIEVLKSKNKISQPLFLSETEYMDLSLEKYQLTPAGGHIEQFNPKAKKFNDVILDNIHLLWNLSYIYFADRLIEQKASQALQEINPDVTFFNPQTSKRNDAKKAKDLLVN